MKAVRFDDRLRMVTDAPVPRRQGEALIEVICAGICNTDLEIVKGYAGFRGTLGHEFVGCVVESADEAWIGRRVAGEINAGCGKCNLCLSGDSRHCAARTVLGIKDRDGAFAQYLALPTRNLIEVPSSISDEEAVFIEPLAAACSVLEQVNIDSSSNVAVVGDGKLAQLILIALAQTGCNLTVIGKHEAKIELARRHADRSFLLKKSNGDVTLPDEISVEKFDMVVEASGSPSGLSMAIDLVKPRGTIVLKSTHHEKTSVEMSPVVVNELKIVGSRCGRFQPAIELLRQKPSDLRALISHRFSLEEAISAFEKAALPESRKVILSVSQTLKP